MKYKGLGVARTLLVVGAAPVAGEGSWCWHRCATRHAAPDLLMGVPTRAASTTQYNQQHSVFNPQLYMTLNYWVTSALLLKTCCGSQATQR